MLKAAMRDNEEPKSDTERILAQVWAKVLGLDLETIKRGDDFLALGGDSLSAIRLVPMIRSRGLRLTTLDILTSPILKDMADLAVNSDDDTATIGLHNDTNGSSVSLQATDFQAWAAFAGADNGGWIDHFIYDFVGSLDVDRLQDSCRRLVAAHSVLRTVFVLRKDKIYLQISAQADIKFDVHRTSEDEIESITQELCGRERIRPLGAPIVRFDLIAVSATQHRLIMRLSHAQYDGFCAKNVGQHLRLLYLSQALPATLPFHEYVNKIQEPEFVQPAEEFWKAHLQGSQMPQLVNRTRSVLPSDKILDGEVRWPIGIPSLKHCGINTAALVKTAWALTVSSLSQSSDVIFGDFVSGRQVPVSGIETVFGPCVNFPPVRVQVKPDLTNFELLKRVQEDLFRSIPHESLGFRHINEHCTDWGQHTRYSSIVNFVGFEPGPGNMRWDTGDGEKQLDVKHIYEEQQHDKTDLWLMCLKRGQAAESASTENSFDLAFRYSKRVYDESAIDEIANIYRDCLLTLATALDATLLAPYISAEQLARLVPTVTT
jgi:aryl carrier-like protein